MIGKPVSGQPPFPWSRIALLIFSLTVINRPGYAASGEAPAVLQFASKYSQQQGNAPTHLPLPGLRQPPPPRAVAVPKQPAPVAAPHRASAERDRQQLSRLQRSVTQKEREISSQNLTIKKLEKQISQLQLASQKAAPRLPGASLQELQQVQKMAGSLRQVFSLRPAPDALAEQLKQANQQAAEARQAEAAMQGKQQALNQQIGDLQRQLTSLKSGRDRAAAGNETALNAQLAKLKAANTQLLSDLDASQKNVTQSAGQVQQLESAMRKLDQEKKQYADENQQLMQQISGRSDAGEQLEAIKAQQLKLQNELAGSRQQLSHLEDEKRQLQQQLTSAPTPAQLADSQQKIKALEDQLNKAQQLQEEKSSASEQAKASSTAMAAEKQEAENKVNALQGELAAAQKAQNDLQAEKERLRQQLSSAPDAAQFADSQLKIKALQGQLDSALMQQKEQRSAGEQAKTSSAAMAAEKQAAEDKINALRGELAAAQKAQNDLQAEKDKLRQQLSSAPDAAQFADSQLKIKVLQGQLDSALLLQKEKNSASEQAKASSAALLAEKQAAEGKVNALQSELAAAQQQHSSVQAEKDKLQQQLAALEKQGATSKNRAVAELTPEKLKTKSTREAYAVGISLGEEILQLQAENRNWAATDSDKPSVLAGIVDAFQGKAKLPPEDLNKALKNINQQVKTGRDKYMGDLETATKKYMDSFTKDKNAKKSETGFWYKIEYPGDTPIPDRATIDVIVKESLTNGIVIEDMDARGIVLTQPASAFPPVFREAISKLKNHGSIKLVVPPGLAYGDRGYPPKVPPNATMVYDLRVSDVYPEPIGKKGKNN